MAAERIRGAGPRERGSRERRGQWGCQGFSEAHEPDAPEGEGRMRADACTRREVMALAAASALAALLPTRPAAAAKSSDMRKEFFDEGRILKLRLELTRDDLNSLRREPRKYVKATIHEA